MANIANLHTTLTADSSQFDAVMKKAQGSASTFASSLKGMAAGFGVSLITTGLINIANKFDDIADNAKKAGISISQFQKLGYIAKFADTNVDALAKGMSRLTKNTFEAQQGNEKLAEAFKELNLDPEKLKGLDAGERLLETVKSLGKMADESRQGYIAQILFGDRNAGEVLAVARSDLNQIEEQFRRTDGLSVGQIEKLSELTDKIKELGNSIVNLFGGIASQLAPLINSIITAADKIISIPKYLTSTGSNAKNGIANGFAQANQSTNGSLNFLSDESWLGRNVLAPTNKVLSWGLGTESFIGKGIYGNQANTSTKPSISTSTSNQPSFNMSSSVSGAMGGFNVGGNSLDALYEGALKTTTALSQFEESILSASGEINNMVDGMIKGNRDSKTQQELSRILEDKMKDPWEMTSKDNERNQETLGFFKDFFKGRMSDDQIKDEFSPYFINKKRPDTANFDKKIQDAFDLIQENPEGNQNKIDSLLKDAGGLAQGKGMRGAVDELRAMQNQRLGLNSQAERVVLQVIPSPEFTTKILSSTEGVRVITDQVGNIVANAAVAAGKQ